MAQGRNGKLKCHCRPRLMREIDMDRLYDRDKDEYCCLCCLWVDAQISVSFKNILLGGKTCAHIFFIMITGMNGESRYESEP